jgi:5-methylcytosine-specific restriction protein A
VNILNIPKLNPRKRDREYKQYHQDIRDRAVYEYLFHGKSHRELDDEVIGVDSNNSRGWQAMNILHYLGLEGSHKGIFKSTSLEQALEIIESQLDNNLIKVYESLQRYNNSILIKSHTWTVVSKDVAFKELDKSCFEHRGTGIPVEVKGFFHVDNINYGERKEIVLYASSREFKAYITITKSLRTRLFWDVDFSHLLQRTFPEYHQQLLQGTLLSEETPKLRLARKEVDTYFATFIPFLNFEVINSDIEADKIENEEPRAEGAVKEYFGKRYERDPINRKRALELHGLSCVVCEFNFEEVYGERGKDFIEVHHVKPLSTLGGTEEQIDPRTDLVPVCSNCHRMIHRRHDNVLTIEDMKSIINGKK